MLLRSRKTPLLLATEIVRSDTCTAVIKALLDGGANPNKPGDRSGTIVLQTLVNSAKIAAAEVCVRAGGRYKHLSGVTAESKMRFDELSSE